RGLARPRSLWPTGCLRSGTGLRSHWPGSRRVHRAADRLQDLAERPLHVLHLVDLLARRLPVEAQHRDAPLGVEVGVDLAEAVLVRHHRAAAAQADGGAAVALA